MSNVLLVAFFVMHYIYIIGEAGFRKYCQLFRNLCYEKNLRISENLNK